MQKNRRRVHNLNYFSHIFFTSLAIILVAVFAYWWFRPSHLPSNFTGLGRLGDLTLFILVSYVIWHPIIMEVLTWCISSHIKDIHVQKPAKGLRVAFITTIVPKNEPVDLLHKCLPAMVNAKYQHDTWLLDEGNSSEVKKICRMYNVKHFSRFGISQFNTKTGKYTKTKGGNHNSWYDIFGDYYDYVAQIDTDFVPDKNFLLKTLGYFRDPKVAFVGTPQIYGNIKKSLIALGAYEQQFSFYGAVLRGLSGMGMTLLIGANHLIRVSAFKKVGHYTAHLTEDLVTGMKLHAAGFKSVYVPYPLAVGEGPASWESYFNQQLRWAYGCIDILFRHSLSYFKKMDFRRAVYYFFLQQHYFSGFAMALSMVLLCLYFLFGIRAADVDIFNFFVIYSFVLLFCWLMSVWLQRFDVGGKKEGQLLLAGKIISIAAWPIWFLAFISVLTGKRLSYKVTPKGDLENEVKISPAVFLPHFIFALLAIAGLVSSIFTHRQSLVMLFWAVSSALFMFTIPFSHSIARKLLKVYKKLAYYLIKSTALKSRGYAFEEGKILLGPPQKRVKNILETFIDLLFLGSVVIFSSLPYIGKLKFYSDDWSFLGNFALSKDQTLTGLYHTATTPNTLMRPMQNLLDAFLYWLFGLNPLGYHIANLAMFAGIILLLYLILHILKLPKIITISVPLIFALLPNYSTDRFWYAAFQVNLSMLLFLLSTFAGLKAFTLNNSETFFWKLVSILSLILSALSYEIILPLVFLNMVLFWNPLERFYHLQDKHKPRLQNHGVFLVLNLIVLVYLVIFKSKTTTRLGDFNYPGDVAHLITSIINANFFELGLKTPLIWAKIIFDYSGYDLLIPGALLGFIIFLYFFQMILRSKDTLPGNLFFAYLTLSGFVVFFFGYAIFFTNNRVGFSPTGIDNRVAVAASIGIALIIVGFSGFLSRNLLPPKLSKWLFIIIISSISMGGFLTINTLASFWADASHRGQAVLADIRSRFPFFPKNTTLILDGVCPYSGPGIVFESQWDLKGALQTIYKEPSIQADIVTPRLKLTENGIQTQIYTFKADYPFENMIIYNFKNKKSYFISGREDAQNYFRQFDPQNYNNCPPAKAGNGVSVF